MTSFHDYELRKIEAIERIANAIENINETLESIDEKLDNIDTHLDNCVYFRGKPSTD